MTAFGTTPKITCVALDYGGTISAPVPDMSGTKPVDEKAVPVLRALHERGLRLVLASNTVPGQDRIAALRRAKVLPCFTAVLQSHELPYRKPDLPFYALVAAEADCDPAEVLFVGNHLEHDAGVPRSFGMLAALYRPHGLSAGERLPEGVLQIADLADLLPLVDAPRGGRC